jgi:SAM-dependent methyltransferase
LEVEDYETIARLEQDNWWYAARRDLVRRCLEAHGPFAVALDLGCGVGANVAVLQSLAREVVAIDPSPEAIRWCHQRGLTAVRLGDATAIDLPDRSVDLVTCLDVLEHVDDDARAMGEIRRVLRPGGWLMVTVPAFPHLWSDNDEFARHRRRYRKAGLRRLLAGLEIQQLGYWNALMYPPMLAFSAWRRVRKPRRPDNNLLLLPGAADPLLRGLLRWENRLRGRLPPPIGTSLLALARQPAQGG